MSRPCSTPRSTRCSREEREGPRLIVLFTTDRGMAGSLNTNTIRFAAQEIAAVERRPHRRAPSVARAPRPCAAAHVPLAASFDGFGDKPAFSDVLPLARLISDDFLAGTYAKVHLLYPAFVSTLVQRPELKRLLPVKPNPETRRGHPRPPVHLRARSRPQSSSSSCRATWPRASSRRVLELTASEHSSRMVAMRNATDNAQELIDDLTLTYNKVRQSNITREMIEIATGASST